MAFFVLFFMLPSVWVSLYGISNIYFSPIVSPIGIFDDIENTPIVSYIEIDIKRWTESGGDDDGEGPPQAAGGQGNGERVGPRPGPGRGRRDVGQWLCRPAGVGVGGSRGTVARDAGGPAGADRDRGVDAL
ncbi:MAG: hypothetical protein OXC68_00025 [Aestuariivita sp.]|nr:hypothetical protein [Aestuariivita sp.]